MKIKILSFIMLGVFCLSFVACSSKEQGQDIDILSVATQITNEIKLEDELMAYDIDLIKNKYGYEGVSAENSIVFGTATMSSPEEVAIFKASNEEELEQIKKAVELTRLEDLKFSFENYGDIQANQFKLDNALIVEKGKYLLFVVAHPDELKKAETIFEKSFE